MHVCCRHSSSLSDDARGQVDAWSVSLLLAAVFTGQCTGTSRRGDGSVALGC